MAFANLGRLQGYDGGPPHHVWYGDSHLDMGDRRHEVEVSVLAEGLPFL